MKEINLAPGRLDDFARLLLHPCGPIGIDGAPSGQPVKVGVLTGAAFAAARFRPSALF
jgi:hypothetical protein